jgi:hypothetical protein
MLSIKSKQEMSKMGNTSNEAEVIIGEVVIDGSSSEAVLNCVFPSNHQVQLIVQDRLGVSVLTAAYSVFESDTALMFDVSKFKAGDYHAWIYIADKVFVRHFKLQDTEGPGLFDKFLSIFK